MCGFVTKPFARTCAQGKLRQYWVILPTLISLLSKGIKQRSLATDCGTGKDDQTRQMSELIRVFSCSTSNACDVVSIDVISFVKFQTYYYAALNNSEYSFAYSIADTDTVRLSNI